MARQVIAQSRKGAAKRFLASLCVCFSMVVSVPAEAFEISGGVNLGGSLMGTEPRLAVSPQVRIGWRADGGFLFAVHDAFSIVPATNRLAVGVYNETSITFGIASDNANFSVGPSLALYSMPACGATLCGRVVGLAPGGHAGLSVYFAGPLGVSVNASVSWVGGDSLVLPGGVAAMIRSSPGRRSDGAGSDLLPHVVRERANGGPRRTVPVRRITNRPRKSSRRSRLRRNAFVPSRCRE